MAPFCNVFVRISTQLYQNKFDYHYHKSYSHRGLTAPLSNFDPLWPIAVSGARRAFFGNLFGLEDMHGCLETFLNGCHMSDTLKGRAVTLSTFCPNGWRTERGIGYPCGCRFSFLCRETFTRSHYVSIPVSKFHLSDMAVC